MIGVFSLFWFLNGIESRSTYRTPNISIEKFKTFFKESSFPDSIKTIDNLSSLYSAVNSSSPYVTFDQFLAKSKVDTLSIFKTLEAQNVRQNLVVLKMRSDQERINLHNTGRDKGPKTSYIHILLAMAAAGLLGGVLANFRGFFEFFREEKEFPEYLQIPYYIRPYTGLLTGLFVFFLTNVILASADVDTNSNFISFRAMISFLGFSILAGFASQEFTERLKAAASSLFGVELKVKNTEQPDKNDSKQESNQNDDDKSKSIPPRKSYRTMNVD